MPARLNAVRTGKHLLKQDKYKDVIMDSLKHMVKEKWIELNVFCIMSNHIHLTCLPAGRYGKFRMGMRERLFNEIF
jgi:REP element-mobilizing transposase RayT